MFAFVAVIGVALAAFYALRLYQRTMHNRLPEGAESREIGAPRRRSCSRRWSRVIVALALWPGLILDRGRGLGDREGRRRRARRLRGRRLRQPLADGADQSAELVTAGSEDCTQEYGLSPIEAISATFPCGTTRPQGGGYLINFCDESEGRE